MTFEPFLKNLVAKRVFFLFVVCALIPVLAIAALSFYQTSQVLREQAFSRLRTANKSYSIALLGRILEAEEHLAAAADAVKNGRPLKDVDVLGRGRRFASLRIQRPAPSFDGRVQEHLMGGKSSLVVDPSGGRRVALTRYVDPAVPALGVLVAELRNDYLWGPPEALPGTEIAAMSDGRLLFSSTTFSERATQKLSDSLGESSTGDLEWEFARETHLVSYRLLFLKPQLAHSGFMIVASQRKAEALAALRAFQALFPPVILLGVLLAALVSITQLRRKMIPLERIVEGTKEIGRGKFSTRVNVHSGDEFEVLAASMNDMAERLEETDSERERQEKIAKERQEQLIQADKMASLGILVSGVAHEVNNPNGLIRLNTELLRNAWADVDTVLAKHYQETGDFPLGAMMYSELATEIPTLLDDSLKGTERIARIVDELKDFARQKPPEITREIDMNTVCQSAVKLIRRAIDAHTDHFEQSYDARPQMVRGDFQRLEQVVVNLLINAFQALPDRDRALRLSTDTSTDKGLVCVRVADEGVGIPADALSRITDPFFTTKRANGGTGLGLSICATIVREHRGRLRFLPRKGGGTTAELTFPQAARS